MNFKFKSWSIEKVKNYEIKYDGVPIQKKYRARDEVLNLYSSQTILAYLFLILLNLVLLCCQLLSIDINKSILAGKWLFCCVANYKSNLSIPE